MRIRILGGGPAGLYFAILMKKADPRHEIAVYERNAPDDTFGWGVVFSDMTQSHLADADRASYDAITERFATWDSIDVRYANSVVRSSGHGFCGLSRKTLLQILQSRAKELGVELHFKREVDDPESLRDCDLLVAADGINSKTRAKYEDRFGPTLDRRPNRYTWLGTHQPFEAFTFSFRENEHGLYMLHGYQFEPETSTFIIETHEDTWRKAGLDRATEADTIAYCERVFAPDLDGHALLGNRSSWIQFTTVKNARWSFENVVLLGDSAHTAHFSVGSGTKLAMEDAIGLTAAFARHDDVSRALAEYERARRTDVESLQRAAQSSLEWFENARRYTSFPKERFVFSLLTRSMRVTHSNLEKRDPGYVRMADRWLAEDVLHGPSNLPLEKVPPMFLPFDLHGLALDNRVVVSAMCQYCAVDGVPTDWHLVHLGSRAVGGAGLVMTEMTNVTEDARITPGCTGLYNDEQLAAFARIVDFVHTNSRAKIGMQLGHAGRKGSTKLMWEGMDAPLDRGGWPVIGPSPIPWAPPNPVPREMTRADMIEVRNAFVRATERTIRAGFDLLELHFAHGYLLSSFLTPVSNERTDEYGGSLANRARFPLEVLDAVREAWGDRPLAVRISATDWVDGAFTDDDAVELAAMLKLHGAHLIDVSTGQTSPRSKPVFGRAYQTPFSDRIRNEVGIATMAVGNISTYDDVNTIVLSGRADLVALARAHLADPYFTLHAAREQGYEGHEWPIQYRSAKVLRYLVK